MGLDYLCAVPTCWNTSLVTPQKLFIHVPKKKEKRLLWLNAIKRGHEDLSNSSTLHVCEDHFDLENDMENFTRWKLVGGKKRMKPHVIPHKFDWSLLRKSRLKLKSNSSNIAKRRPIITYTLSMDNCASTSAVTVNAKEDDSQFRLPLYSDHSYRLTSPYDFVAVNDRLEATSTKTSDTLLGDIKIEEDPLNLHESCEDVGTSDVRIKTEIDCFDAKRQEFDESPGPSELHCFPIKNEIEPWQFRETNGNCEIEEVFCDNLKLEIEVGDVIKTELEES